MLRISIYFYYYFYIYQKSISIFLSFLSICDHEKTSGSQATHSTICIQVHFGANNAEVHYISILSSVAKNEKSHAFSKDLVLI